MTAPRRARRDAARRLTPTKPYTFKAVGEVLTLMARGLYVRGDGALVSMVFELDRDGGDTVQPAFVTHHTIGSWRVRVARWLIGVG